MDCLILGSSDVLDMDNGIVWRLSFLGIWKVSAWDGKRKYETLGERLISE